MPGWVGDPTSYPGRRANVAEETNFALWPAGIADLASVLDEQVREHRPPVAGKEPNQVSLDLHWINLPGERQPLGDAAHMRIDDHPFVFSKGVAEDDVGRLSPHAGEGDERLQVVRHAAGMPLGDRGRHADETLGLVAKEARRLDDLFDVFLFGGGERGG